jgi:hypothetical protein
MMQGEIDNFIAELKGIAEYSSASSMLSPFHKRVGINYGLELQRLYLYDAYCIKNSTGLLTLYRLYNRIRDKHDLYLLIFIGLELRGRIYESRNTRKLIKDYIMQVIRDKQNG